MRGALGHPPAAAARTDRPPLTGKRHEAIEPAPAAVKPGEAAREEAAAEKPAELLLDEPRQRVPFVDAGGVGPERLEMIADHLIQHALRGRLRRVVWGGAAHTSDVAKRAPQGPSRDLRANPWPSAGRAVQPRRSARGDRGIHHHGKHRTRTLRSEAVSNGKPGEARRIPERPGGGTIGEEARSRVIHPVAPAISTSRTVHGCCCESQRPSVIGLGTVSPTCACHLFDSGYCNAVTSESASLTNIGKESNSLEEVQAGIEHDEADVYPVYKDPRRRDWQTKVLPAVRQGRAGPRG